MTDETASVTEKKTAFYEYHKKAGAKMVPFAGYIMPIQYRSITEEHLAVRENVGLFDISHMGEFEVSGQDALPFIQKMTVNDVSKLQPGDIQYSCMCYENGGIVDDLLVYRLADRYMLVVNAANLEKDFDWLESHLEGNVRLDNISDATALLAIQGPRALKLTSELTDFDLDSLVYYSSASVAIAGHKVLLSRTGYTGEDGFEIYIPNRYADDIWQAVVTAGEHYDLKFIGLGARDSLRLEMKMALYGNDIDQDSTPIEAGLSWIVHFDSGDFIGREVLKKQKDEKPKRRLICLELEGRAYPRHGYEIYSNADKIGAVTSGTFSPSLQKPIALGYLPLPLTKLGNKVEIKIRDKFFPATVVKPPFYKKGSHR
jgi:aminomethyltransferase